jgi:hypothetical protein
MAVRLLLSLYLSGFFFLHCLVASLAFSRLFLRHFVDAFCLDSGFFLFQNLFVINTQILHTLRTPSLVLAG